MTRYKSAQRGSAEEKDHKRGKNKRPATLEVESPGQKRLSVDREYEDNHAFSQASRLGDKRLLTIQRQNLALRLGKLLGNNYLQQQITSLSDQEQPVEVAAQETHKMDIQRISIATGAAPAGWQVVPAKHRGRVRAAIAIIQDKVANNTRLRNYFRHNAPGGTNATLQNVSNRAQVWEMINEGALGESYVGGSDMAYDPYIYRIGRWQIASTLLHEMGHLANFPTEQACEETLEAAYAYCPFIERITPRRGRVGDEIVIRGMSFGPSQTPNDKIEFNGVDAGMAVSWSWSHAGGEIRVRVPTGATTGPVCVINNNIRSNEVNFTVLP